MDKENIDRDTSISIFIFLLVPSNGNIVYEVVGGKCILENFVASFDCRYYSIRILPVAEEVGRNLEAGRVFGTDGADRNKWGKSSLNRMV